MEIVRIIHEIRKRDEPSLISVKYIQPGVPFPKYKIFTFYDAVMELKDFPDALAEYRRREDIDSAQVGNGNGTPKEIKILPQDAKFICGECGLGCSTKDAVANHINGHHPRVEIYQNFILARKTLPLPLQTSPGTPKGSKCRQIAVKNVRRRLDFSTSGLRGSLGVAMKLRSNATRIYNDNKVESCMANLKVSNTVNLVDNMETTNPKRVKYSCGICGVGYSTKAPIVIHMVRMHRNVTNKSTFVFEHADHKINKRKSPIKLNNNNGIEPRRSNRVRNAAQEKALRVKEQSDGGGKWFERGGMLWRVAKD